MKRFIIPLLFVFVFITACSPDPRKEAEALRIRLEAEQNALDAQQNRQHAQQLHEFELQRRAMEQQNAQAVQAQWQLARNRAVWLLSITIVLVFCYSIISVSKTINRTIEGVGAALVRRADVAANLIKLDPVTRQFPILIQHVHGEKYALHNPNTGSVVMLDASVDADRQLIATAGATQIAGVIAQEARKSADPAGVAIMQPTVVNVKDELITVGKEVLNR